MAQETTASVEQKSETKDDVKHANERGKTAAKGESRPVAMAEGEKKPAQERKPKAGAKSPKPVPLKKSSAPVSSAKSSGEDDRPLLRRRPAGPARSRIAANDDLPSIGGLIFALQQRPSQRPFTIASVLTGAWLLLGTLFAWVALSDQYNSAKSIFAILSSPATLSIIATILLPIALFWFLALLAWRSQELRLVSSAMTEVAVRLAEPDRMAEQSVASLGQTVRRQVAAMNDAIARALGRAGELEALVHNEVAALERSYSENELRIRRLIDELANERTMLNSNSERMGDAIRGIGNQVAREIHMASDQATQALNTATENVAENFAARGEKVTSAMRAAGAAIDERLAKQGAQITDQFVQQGAKAADDLKSVGDQINNTLRRSTDETTALITAKGNTLLTSITSMHEKIAREMPTLLEQMGGEQARLSAIIGDAVNNLAALESALTHQTGRIETTLTDRTGHLENVLTNHLRSVDKSLSDRTQMLDAAIGQRTRAIDASLGERAKAFDAALHQKAALIDASLVERTKSIDAAFSRHVVEIDSSISRQTEAITKALIDRSQLIQATMNEQATMLDQTFLKGVEAIRLTTDRLSNKSVDAIEALSSQADVMKSVAEGLLRQVGGLTQKFESQGQAVMSAAQLLESSQFKMDSVLESRREELSGLLENISTKASELDHMMHSYSGKLESSLTNAQERAKELSQEITSDSQEKSQRALAELEMMRSQTTEHAETAIADLRDRFSAVTQQVTNQIGNLSSMFMDTTKGLEESAKTAAQQIEETQSELRQRIKDLPDETSQNAEAMRMALSDQLRAMDELNSIARHHSAGRDVTPPLTAQFSDGKAPQGTKASPAKLDVPPAARRGNGSNGGGAANKRNQNPSARPGEGFIPKPGAAPAKTAPSQADYDAITESIAQTVAQLGAKADQLASEPSNVDAKPLSPNGPKQTKPQPLQQPRDIISAQMSGRKPKGNARAEVPVASAPQGPEAEGGKDSGSKWSMGDLLARASDEDVFGGGSSGGSTDSVDEAPKPPQTATPVPAGPFAKSPQGGMARSSSTQSSRPNNGVTLNIKAIAQAVNSDRAEEIWQRYQGGERGLFSRELYTRDGQLTFDDTQRRLGFDKDYRETVTRYLDDFEHLLTEADQKDPAGQLLSNYLNSDTGRAYLLLSHASGRLS